MLLYIMLPEAHDSPACFLKLPIYGSITLHIAHYLVPPVSFGKPCRCEIESIAVPEIAINKQCYFSRYKHCVRTPRKGIIVLAVSIAF